MNNLRAWNRRDFSVTPNGYFTVLKPMGWFSTLPLPGGFRYLIGPPNGIPSPEAFDNSMAAPQLGTAFVPGQANPNYADSQKTALPLQFTSLGTQDRHLTRPALIVVAAAAISWILLWCTSHP